MRKLRLWLPGKALKLNILSLSEFTRLSFKPVVNTFRSCHFLTTSFFIVDPAVGNGYQNPQRVGEGQAAKEEKLDTAFP